MQAVTIENLKNQLRQYKKKYYTNALLRGSIFLLAFLSTVYVTFVLFEYFAQTGSGTRTFLFYFFICLLGATALLWVVNPIVKLVNNGRTLSDEVASQQIGEFFPEIQDKILNTLQLGRIDASGGSLIAGSIAQRTTELSQFNFGDAVQFDKNRRYLKYIFIPAGIILAVVLYNSAILKEGTSRILNYSSEMNDMPFSFSLEEGSLETFRNEDFKVDIHIESTTDVVPNEVTIVSNGARRKMSKEDFAHFTHNFGKLQQSFDFTLEANGFKSQKYHVDVRNRPQLDLFDVYVEYPQYLNRKSELFENSGNLSIPEGSSVMWKLKTSAADSVYFTINGKQVLAEKQTDRIFEHREKNIKTSGNYGIQLKNEFSYNKDSISYQIDVLADQYPKISVNGYQDTTMFSYLLIGGAIADDYGLTRLRLFYNVLDSKGAKRYKNSRSKSIGINYAQTEQSFFYQLELDSLNIGPGEQIEYSLAVWDNDGINGAKRTSTKNYTFRVPSSQEMEESIEKSTKEAENQIDNTLEKIKNVNDELKKLEDKLKAKKRLEYQDKKQIEELLKQQKELEKEVEKLNEKFNQDKDKKERFSPQDEEMKKKMEQLQKLMDELLDDETKKLQEELQKLLNEKANDEEIKKALEKMKDKDNTLEKEVERALEMFKQMKFDQKLEEATDKLEKLSEKQEELAKESEEKKSDADAIKEKQEELNKEFEEIKKDLNELNKINESMENKKNLEDTKKQEQSIEQEMQKSSESLDKKNKKSAGENQKKAAEEQKKLAQQLNDMKSSMEQEQMEEDMQALRDILENLITLSYDQEDLMTEFREVNQRDPRFVELSQKQLKLKDDAQIIEDSLYALAKRVYQLESFITREVSTMKGYMDESVEALRDRKPGQASGKQQFAMTSMNNLALMLNDVLKQMQEDMGKKKDGDQMCNKPGKGSKPKPMGDMQKQLNQMIQDIKDGKKGGRELSQQLAEAAAQQEMIRRALKKMREEMKEKGMKEGGNLGDLEKQMEKTEEDLINKNITPETIRRQRDILTRLLEAEKAMRERDLDDKREAEKAKEKEQTVPPAFEEYIKQKQKQIDLLKTIPPSLTPYYKKEVNEYFESIE